MNIEPTNETYLKSCLKGCDFSTEESEQYIQYARENRTDDTLHILNRKRKLLMDNLHLAQRKVDTVDFMIRSLKNTEGSKNERNRVQSF